MDTLKLLSDRKSLLIALDTMPISSLVAIAAEIMRVRGPEANYDPTADTALEKLLFDVAHVAQGKVENFRDFEELMNWHYKSFNSREWYQVMIAAQVNHE